jgi:plastocyanin
MTRLPTSLLAAAAVTVVAAAGCGSDDGSAGGGGAYGGAPAKTTATKAAAPAAAGTPLTLSADEAGGLAFAPKTLTTKAGTVALTMDNPGANGKPHAIAIEGDGVDEAGQIAQPGGTSSVSVTLKPGRYTLFCPVGSHRAEGMEGTLTVS